MEQIKHQNFCENLTKFKDEEATTTTAGESCDERDRVIPNLEPGVDTHFLRLEDDEATTTKADESLEDGAPNLRIKFCQHFKIQTQIDSIREKVDKDDNAEIVKARMMKMARISREVIRKKPCRQPTNSRRIKRVRITETWINCAAQFGKWWIMTASMQPYTCAANRYAKFRSNRRYKPGD